jgi:hypothetical protein
MATFPPSSPNAFGLGRKPATLVSILRTALTCRLRAARLIATAATGCLLAFRNCMDTQPAAACRRKTVHSAYGIPLLIDPVLPKHCDCTKSVMPLFMIWSMDRASPLAAYPLPVV